jgi:hypothetical protein
MSAIGCKADIAIQGRHVRSTDIGFVAGFGLNADQWKF